jgi:hypothetical protein
VIDRIRDLLDRPLDRRQAEAIVAIAASVTFAFGVLVALGIVGRPASNPPASREDFTRPTAPSRVPAGALDHPPASGDRHPDQTQDPQDRKGTAAYGRARRAARDHRALQHLPYRHGGVTVALVGAEQGRAVLRIAAPTIAAAHRGWRDFLRRFADDGGAYEARFQVRARNGITGRRKVARGAARGAARPDGATRAGRRRIRHQHTDRGARSFLTSKPHPNASP